MTSHICATPVPARRIVAAIAALMMMLTAFTQPVFTERMTAAARARSTKVAPLTIIEVKERDGQILSYRHLAAATEVHMRGTKRAPDARVKLKVGSRPGFVELDINRHGVSGLQPAHLLGKDFLTYVLWAVSVDGKASNLGEITFEGDRPVAVNVTTTYQTFWLMVTAEPNYAVVDPSPVVVLYSAKGGDTDKGAIPIDRPLFFFTHYSSYESARIAKLPDIPNQLLQARKAVELTSRTGVLRGAAAADDESKEEEYTREAMSQATAFLKLAENAYKSRPSDKEVIQFARTAAQSAENARALAAGAVGGLLVREMAREVDALRAEVEQLRASEHPGVPVAPQAVLTVTTRDTSSQQPPRAGIAALVRQPALWFAVSGWGLAIVLLFRRRTL
jgi:hypothetical protein